MNASRLLVWLFSLICLPAPCHKDEDKKQMTNYQIGPESALLVSFFPMPFPLCRSAYLALECVITYFWLHPYWSFMHFLVLFYFRDFLHRWERRSRYRVFQGNLSLWRVHPVMLLHCEEILQFVLITSKLIWRLLSYIFWVSGSINVAYSDVHELDGNAASAVSA